jgi:hypothetical protein
MHEFIIGISEIFNPNVVSGYTFTSSVFYKIFPPTLALAAACMSIQETKFKFVYVDSSQSIIEASNGKYIESITST